jgi:predicted O-methyltransferase YrrM
MVHMPSGSQDDRTLARRVKHGVATTVRSMPKGFRERVANLVLPPDERSATVPVDAPEVIRRGAEIPFEVWEQHGWHLTPNHFYSVIPDTRVLPDSLWTTESELSGIDMRDEAQLAFLTDAVGRFGTELNALPRRKEDAGPGQYFVDNGAFESVDAEALHSMVRMHKPGRIVEIGSGWSTLVSMAALDLNKAEGSPGTLTAIEPYPHAFVKDAITAHADATLVDEQVQGVPMDTFSSLGENDILFIDSSHVLKIGSDVQYEFLEVLPRLRPGVLVHVHDIFLPGEYPKDWVYGEEHRFWNEQYLLQAFLTDNAHVEVVWASNWMHRRHPDELEKALDSYDRNTRFPGSFWFRRV